MFNIRKAMILVLIGTITRPAGATCPQEKPNEFDFCDFDSFETDEACTYDNDQCCPDNGFCARTGCSCYDSQFSCSGRTRQVDCPSLCPVEKPSEGDTCDTSAEFACAYGEELTCPFPDSLRSSSSFAKKSICYCSFGEYRCSDFQCCPDGPPEEGSVCSEFMGQEDFGRCEYGEPLCCPGGSPCTSPSAQTCECGFFSNTASCFTETLSCPSLCPDPFPVSGDSCDFGAEVKLFECASDEVVICPGFEYLGEQPVSQCRCGDSGVFDCENFSCYGSPNASPTVSSFGPTSTYNSDPPGGTKKMTSKTKKESKTKAEKTKKESKKGKDLSRP